MLLTIGTTHNPATDLGLAATFARRRTAIPVERPLALPWSSPTIPRKGCSGQHSCGGLCGHSTRACLRLSGPLTAFCGRHFKRHGEENRGNGAGRVVGLERTIADPAPRKASARVCRTTLAGTSRASGYTRHRTPLRLTPSK